jgi:hypothetical protein
MHDLQISAWDLLDLAAKDGMPSFDEVSKKNPRNDKRGSNGYRVE